MGACVYGIYRFYVNIGWIDENTNIFDTSNLQSAMTNAIKKNDLKQRQGIVMDYWKTNMKSGMKDVYTPDTSIDITQIETQNKALYTATN
jgi:chitinase